MYEITLENTTAEEVLRRLPSAWDMTFHADERGGSVSATVEAESHEDAVSSGVQAGFTVT